MMLAPQNPKFHRWDTYRKCFPLRRLRSCPPPGGPGARRPNAASSHPWSLGKEPPLCGCCPAEPPSKKFTVGSLNTFCGSPANSLNSWRVKYGNPHQTLKKTKKTKGTARNRPEKGGVPTAKPKTGTRKKKNKQTSESPNRGRAESSFASAGSVWASLPPPG